MSDLDTKTTELYHRLRQGQDIIQHPLKYKYLALLEKLAKVNEAYAANKAPSATERKQYQDLNYHIGVTLLTGFNWPSTALPFLFGAKTFSQFQSDFEGGLCSTLLYSTLASNIQMIPFDALPEAYADTLATLGSTKEEVLAGAVNHFFTPDYNTLDEAAINELGLTYSAETYPYVQELNTLKPPYEISHPASLPSKQEVIDAYTPYLYQVEPYYAEETLSNWYLATLQFCVENMALLSAIQDEAAPIPYIAFLKDETVFDAADAYLDDLSDSKRLTFIKVIMQQQFEFHRMINELRNLRGLHVLASQVASNTSPLRGRSSDVKPLVDSMFIP